jgi:hypothetical protein
MWERLSNVYESCKREGKQETFESEVKTFQCEE